MDIFVRSMSAELLLFDLKILLIFFTRESIISMEWEKFVEKILLPEICHGNDNLTKFLV